MYLATTACSFLSDIVLILTICTFSYISLSNSLRSYKITCVFDQHCTIHPGVAKLIRRWIKSIDIIDINRYNPPILLSNDIGINKLESKSQN